MLKLTPKRLGARNLNQRILLLKEMFWNLKSAVWTWLRGCLFRNNAVPKYHSGFLFLFLICIQLLIVSTIELWCVLASCLVEKEERNLKQAKREMVAIVKSVSCDDCWDGTLGARSIGFARRDFAPFRRQPKLGITRGDRLRRGEGLSEHREIGRLPPP